MSRQDWVTRPKPILVKKAIPAPAKKPKPAPAAPKVKPLPPCARRALEGETLHLFPVRQKGGHTRLAALPVGNGQRLFGVQHIEQRADGSPAPMAWVNFNEEEARTLALVLAAFLEGGAE